MGTIHQNVSYELGADSRIRAISQVFEGAYPNGPSGISVTFATYGVEHTLTEANLTSANVYVDTVAPVASLYGPTPYLVPAGTDSSAIPGAHASDADPKYVDYDMYGAPNGTLGAPSAVRYEYVPVPDTAGNVADGAVRNVIVYTLEASSDNTSPQHAKAGDVVEVKLELGFDVTVDSFSILGVPMGEYRDGQGVRPVDGTGPATGTVSGSVAVYGEAANGPVQFEIVVANGGKQYVMTEANLTAPNVSVDTVKPVITTIDGSYYRTMQYGTFIDGFGASVTDNDPQYRHTVSSNISSIDTAETGRYVAGFAAVPDAAGNVPDPVTRTVLVYAVTASTNGTLGRAGIGDLLYVNLDVGGAGAGGRSR